MSWSTLVSSRTAALGIGSLTLAVAGVGVGIAEAGGHASTIRGCVAKSDGALRVVHGAEDCTSHETSISWNKQGPKGSPGQSASSGTFQMYANVDQFGNLGSHFGAVSASDTKDGPPSGHGDRYVVTFDHPVGSCAAQVQAGYAAGNDSADEIAAEVTPGSGPNALDVIFGNAIDGDSTADGVPSAFMITVTCAD